MRTLDVGRNDAGQRADKFLTKTLVNLPQSLLYKFLRKKLIKLNGKKCEISTHLNEGDVFTLYIPDEFFPVKDLDTTSKYALPHLDLSEDEIAYEDENLLIVDKEAGITVHPQTEDEAPSKSGNDVYLIDKILGYLYKKGDYRPEAENSFCPALCNRLDRNTAGLIIAAKNAEALRLMNGMIRERAVKKQYYCEAEGIFDRKSGILSDYLYKNKEQNRVYIFKSREQAKKQLAIRYDDDIKTVKTGYTVKGELDGRSLVLIDLITGRTHQIRAHLAFYGHPLVGDGKYGIVHSKKETDRQQALYSYRLTFKFSENTDAGILSYLNGVSVTGHVKDFMKKYGLSSY